MRQPNIIEQLRGCDGFMWRHTQSDLHREIATRLLPVAEDRLGVPVYPDQKTCWHYEDKIAEHY